MDRGTQRLVSGGPGAWAESVSCHRKAVGLLGELASLGNPGYLADLGAAWVNLGCALQAGTSRDSLGEALDAFDRAIGFLERLPYTSDSRFRHNLSAAWMNQAGALVQVDTGTSRARALRTYHRAIDLARGLPLDEKPSFRVLLGSIWINLGNLEQRLSSLPESIEAYDAAVAALGNLPRSGHRLACHHAATAWTNRGEALLAAASFQEAIESAAMALAQVEGRDLGGPVDAKLSLRALRVTARGLEAILRGETGRRAGRIAALTDVAERGIDLAAGGHGRDPGFFEPFIVWFFSFGCRIYARYQPQFLAEYLSEVLGRMEIEPCSGTGAELRAIARQATVGALEELGRGRMLVEGTRQTELLMDTVRELRGAAVQLES